MVQKIKFVKNYYAECSITYTDKSEDEIYIGVENYSMTLRAKSKNDAEYEAKVKSKEIFEKEINDGYSHIVVAIEQCYETSDDARSS